MIKDILIDLEGWLQGMLLLLITYNIITYYFIKDKSFIIYALYLISLIIFLIPDTHNEISQYLYKKNKNLFVNGIWVLQTIYSILYAYFTYYFLDLDKVNSFLSRTLKNYVKYISIVSFTYFSIDALFLNYKSYMYYNLFVFIPVGLLVFAILLKETFLLKSVVRNFYLMGLFILIIFSLITLYYTFAPHTNFMIANGIDEAHFLMFGCFIEVLLLSLGLGYKNLKYVKEREKSNTELIKKLEENKFLRKKINEELQEKVLVKKQEIETITNKIEQYKIAEAQNRFKNELHKLKLTSLLNQMKPHFIFNALNSIKLFIINNDAKNAVYYLNKFSKLVRKILNASTQKETTLCEELKTLELYLNIENIRFSNKIQYTVNIDKSIDLDTLIVPSLILQPFVENAIWHGLSTKKGKKEISLFANTSAQFLTIKIQDNGIGRKAAAVIKQKRTVKRKSLGIEITKERLQEFAQNCSTNFSLAYTDLFDSENNPNGTLVILKIPLK